MIKLTGCLLLIMSTCLMGHMKASAYKARCRELEDIIESVKLLEIEITYRKEALAKAFRKISTVRHCWFSNVLRECSTELEDGHSLEDSWKIAIGRCREASPLEEGDIGIIEDLVHGLGKSDSDGQQKIIEPALIRLRSASKEAYISEQKMGKMYKALGAASGIVIAILIL